jgi:hypothetical protein
MRYGKAFAIGSALWTAGMTSAASAATIAQFNFDSSTDGGITFKDISNGGHDAVFNRAVTTTSSNRSFSPAGDNSVVETTQGGTNTTQTVALLNNTSGISLNTNSGFTIEGWVNLSSLPTENAFLVEIKASGTDIYLGVDTNGQALARFFSSNGSNKMLTGTSTLQTGTWTHLAFTYLNGGTAATSPGTLYVNGNSEASFEYNRGLPTSVTAIYVGGNSSSGGAYGSPYGGMTGKIDDVLIADRTYSQSQVQYDAAHSFTSVPEPTTAAVLALGGLMLIRRRRRA